MLLNILNKIKEVIKNMLNIKESNCFNVDIKISDEMKNSIEMWNNIYINKADWLNEDIKSLNLASAVSSEFARLTTLEMEINISGSARADFLQKIYNDKIKNNIVTNLEFANATGGMVFKPYINNKNEICIDFIKSDSFYPVNFDSNGNITSAIFPSRIVRGNHFYTRLEYHSLNYDIYTISNKAFMSEIEYELGNEIRLEDVDVWSNIQEEVNIKNIEKPLFSYYKVPIANNIDIESPCGVSCFSRAVELIKEADTQFGRTMWEYVSSEKAIYADVTSIHITEDGKSRMPSLNKRIFKLINSGRDDFFQEFSPEIRDESFWRGLNKILQRIEFNCCLAYGTISDLSYVEKTASEINSSKQRSYATVTQMQKSLENALEGLFYAIDTISTLYHLSNKGTFNISYKWDDSIITDSDKEREQDRNDVRMGLMLKEEYRAKWYGEDIEQSRNVLYGKKNQIDKEVDDDEEQLTEESKEDKNDKQVNKNT